jgi:hypothetical protein
VNRLCSDAAIPEGTIQAGTILIEEGAFVPESLHLESAPDAEGWKCVEPADRHELERDIRQAGSIFFLVAREITSTAFGFDQKKAVRVALQRIISSVKLQRCNSRFRGWRLNRS